MHLDGKPDSSSKKNIWSKVHFTTAVCMFRMKFQSLFPYFRKPYDARVYYWVRDSEKTRGFDEELGTFLKQWLQDAWPIQHPVFPGRSLSWEEWEAFKQ